MEVARYLVRGADRGAVRICSGRAERAALSEQIPALVELDFQLLQSLRLRNLVADPIGVVLPQGVFLTDESPDGVVAGR